MLIQYDFFTHTVRVLLMHTLLILSAVHSQFGTYDPTHTYKLYAHTLVHGLQILHFFILASSVCIDPPLPCVWVFYPLKSKIV